MAAPPDDTFVEPIGERAPTEVYRAGKAWSTGSPIKRSRKNQRRIR